MNFDLRNATILMTVAGSRAYGIHTDTSDVDIKGVAVPPWPYFLGYLQTFDQADKASHMDVYMDTMNAEETAAIGREKLEGSIYGLVKFCKLAADCNPNILDVLFCRDDEVRIATPVGRKLRENRELFLSAKAKHTFSGYAAAQLKRIRGHRKWLLDPPTHKPTRDEYDLPEFTLIPKDQLVAAEASVRKQVDTWEIDWSTMLDSEKVYVTTQVSQFLGEISAALGMGKEDAKWLAAARVVGLDENLIETMKRERGYTGALRHFKQYENWKKSRNPARAALEAKHGFDTKHGAHLVRLLRMAREILTEGNVNVWRGNIDRTDLLGIRAGEWGYDALVDWAETEDKALHELYKKREYVVPKAPNRNAIDALVVELVEEFHGVASGDPRVVGAGDIGTVEGFLPSSDSASRSFGRDLPTQSVGNSVSAPGESHMTLARLLRCTKEGYRVVVSYDGSIQLTSDGTTHTRAYRKEPKTRKPGDAKPLKPGTGMMRVGKDKRRSTKPAEIELAEFEKYWNLATDARGNPQFVHKPWEK